MTDTLGCVVLTEMPPRLLDEDTDMLRGISELLLCGGELRVELRGHHSDSQSRHYRGGLYSDGRLVQMIGIAAASPPSRDRSITTPSRDSPMRSPHPAPS